ncbi:hypothetical protein CIHG_01542 [Coccidioides immitis H538.4]|uniref:Uncharacterized protein n=2 Tax=Coccidioides immitis TaxID=5501 RepID=A0A0J8RIF2_COCIT|nr:hypothetical protein CIRG_01393 [Coccidioides immitis RMSCC 2394]KMU83759.1 hypothetical protein CIHG_01542 [Coccidioides immitis H538.4]
MSSVVHDKQSGGTIIFSQIQNPSQRVKLRPTGRCLSFVVRRPAAKNSQIAGDVMECRGIDAYTRTGKIPDWPGPRIAGVTRHRRRYPSRVSRRKSKHERSVRKNQAVRSFRCWLFVLWVTLNGAADQPADPGEIF